jgi:ribonucleoside-triphosphate reductase
MKESGVGYGSVNHPVDRDPVCGYTGIIDNECPHCGRHEDDGEPKFERIRRITGYLVGTLDRFNDAKTAEVRDRVKHQVRLETSDLEMQALSEDASAEEVKHQH